jgi:hypothetical protein
MLCVMARDFVLSEAPDDHPDTHLKFAQSFGVVEFLSTLLRTPELLLDTPAGTSRRKTMTIKTDFADARMNFTHWVSTKTPLKPDGLQSLLHTLVHAQAAMQLSPNQVTWDLLIPIYLGKRSEPLNPKKLTAMLIQVKNQQSSSIFSVSEKAYAMFPPELPLITIMLDLARPEPGVEAVTSFRSNLFAFKVSGCSDQTFGVLTPKTSTTVGLILQVAPPRKNDIQREAAANNDRWRHHTFKDRFPQCAQTGTKPSGGVPDSPEVTPTALATSQGTH